MKDLIKLLEKRRENISELLNSRKNKLKPEQTQEMRGALQELDFVIATIKEHNEKALEKRKDESIFSGNESQLNKLTEIFTKKKVEDENSENFVNKNLLIK